MVWLTPWFANEFAHQPGAGGKALSCMILSFSTLTMATPRGLSLSNRLYLIQLHIAVLFLPYLFPVIDAPSISDIQTSMLRMGWVRRSVKSGWIIGSTKIVNIPKRLPAKISVNKRSPTIPT